MIVYCHISFLGWFAVEKITKLLPWSLPSRTNSFAFIASLPDESKDYLMKLKMIRPLGRLPGGVCGVVGVACLTFDS